MTKVILIRGNAASGKTSLAQSLQDNLEGLTMLLSQDNLRRTILKVKDGPDTPTIPLFLRLLKTGKDWADTIIIEGILVAVWYQVLWEALLDDFPGEIYAYYYDLTFEETCRRHATRPKSREFGEDSLARWWVEKDYLPNIPEKTIPATSSLENSLQTILKDIKDGRYSA